MISVIIPVYNAGNCIQKTIDSLLSQTFQNYEVLLIDDGSTDLSGVICDKASCRDKRFKTIHQENRGVSFARNRGIDEAIGEWVVFIDADDTIPRNYLDELLNVVRNSSSDIAVCDVAMYESDGHCVHRFALQSGVISSTDGLNMLLSRRGINSGPCGKIIRRELARRFSFPNLKAYEDILYIKDLFSAVDSIAITSLTEYQYIQNKRGAMNTFIENPTKDIVVVTDELVRFIASRHDLSDDCLYITLSHLYQYVLSLKGSDSSSVKGFILEAKRVFKKSRRAIVLNHSFSWKEKVLYLFFSLI